MEKYLLCNDQGGEWAKWDEAVAAVAAERERCAKVCEELAEEAERAAEAYHGQEHWVMWQVARDKGIAFREAAEKIRQG